jgi:hypothetical protein
MAYKSSLDDRDWDNAPDAAKASDWSIECPCCGDDAAFGAKGDEIVDGQPLACGCVGHISVDSENEAYAFADDCCCQLTDGDS